MDTEDQGDEGKAQGWREAASALLRRLALDAEVLASVGTEAGPGRISRASSKCASTLGHVTQSLETLGIVFGHFPL